jgi:chromosome segregation ATPase
MLNKIIITVLFVLFSTVAHGQESFPRFEKDSLGNKYVAISMEQARYVDNKLDILKLMQENEMLGFGLDSLNVKVVNDLENVIATQSIQIDNLSQLVDNKDEQIYNLQSQIANYMLSEVTYESQITNLNKKVDIYDEQVKRLERKVFWGGVGGVILIIGAVLIGGAL